MLPPLYFNCTYIFSLQSCVPVKSKCDDSQAGRQVSSDLWRCDPCYEHTAVVTAVNTLENADIPVSHLRFFMPMWSCSLLFAQSTLPFIHTQALSLVTWRSWKGRRSWWPRRKGSGGLGASITELESSPPIMSDQKIQMWVHILRVNMQYFISILFCWHPALRQVWAEINVLERKENP